MNQANQTKARILPIRRLALLATTVAGLARRRRSWWRPTLSPYAPHGAGAESCRRRRSSVARPTGFADIVEKVKPAVISVRVKMRTEAQAFGIVRRRESVPQGLADGEVLQALRHA